MEHGDKHESGPSDFRKWSSLPLGTSRRHLIEKVLSTSYDELGLTHELSLIMQSTWWSRIWVLQEILVSRSSSFIYGPQRAAAEEFIMGIHLCRATLEADDVHLIPLDRRRKYPFLVRLRALANVLALNLYRARSWPERSSLDLYGLVINVYFSGTLL